MITSNRQTTAKRTEIADAALRIIGERGIIALSMASLATELGVSPGAPYSIISTPGPRSWNTIFKSSFSDGRMIGRSEAWT